MAGMDFGVVGGISNLYTHYQHALDNTVDKSSQRTNSYQLFAHSLSINY